MLVYQTLSCWLNNDVIGVDILQEKVDLINAKRSPFVDSELSEFLSEQILNLSLSTDLASAVKEATYVIISTPTNYDEETNFFDTSSVEEVIKEIITAEPNACIVIRSTIPVGFVEDMRKKYDTSSIMFSPEFLREGSAL